MSHHTDFLLGTGRTDTRTCWKGTGGNDTVATTGYTFDAFGRLTRVRARDASETTIVDFQRGYDYNGNPLYTEYGHKTTRSELYGTQTGENPEGPADALNRLTRYRRGTLDGDKTDLSATVFAQDWHDKQGARKRPSAVPIENGGTRRASPAAKLTEARRCARRRAPVDKQPVPHTRADERRGYIRRAGQARRLN